MTCLNCGAKSILDFHYCDDCEFNDDYFIKHLETDGGK